MVRTHPETRKKCLFVSRSYVTRFEGMTVEESAPLLNFLYEHSARPEFTCRFRWRNGSIALWDNRAALGALIEARRPAIVLNTTAFSALREDDTTVLDRADVPVLQVVLSGSARSAWSESGRGLSPSDLAMNVVLPELDGRLLTRAISFK